MNAKELAKVVGVHHNTIYNMIKKGELKAEKKNKTYEVDEDQAQKLIASKNILKAENNAKSGLEDVLMLLEEKQRQTFLKIIDQMFKFQNEVMEVINNSKGMDDLSMHKKLIELTEDSSYYNLAHFINDFEQGRDMKWTIESLKDDYSLDNYQSINVKRLKSKYEELDKNMVKYSLDDIHILAANSLSLHI